MLYEVMWLIVTMGAIPSYVYMIINWEYFKADPEKREMNPARIIFIITARFSESIIQETVDAVHKSCSKAGLKDYDVKLVVDEYTLDKNIELPKERYPLNNVDTITVPENYPQTTRFKARALEYALQFLPNDKEVWFLHLDEDTIVTTQCVMSIMKYIEEGGNPVACGPIVYSSKIRKIFPLFVEANRMWTHFWLIQQMHDNEPVYINGSNLLVRSDIEHYVGWEFGKSITEDSRFAIEVNKKVPNAFGWHGGVSLEQPPANMMALFRQRRRWFAGGLQNLKFMSRRLQAKRIFSNICWTLSFGVTLIFFIILFDRIFDFDIFKVNNIVLNAMHFTIFLWLVRYQIGLKLILDYTDFKIPKKIIYHFIMIPLTPLNEFFSTLPVIWALIAPPKSFDVTKKS